MGVAEGEEVNVGVEIGVGMFVGGLSANTKLLPKKCKQIKVMRMRTFFICIKYFYSVVRNYTMELIKKNSLTNLFPSFIVLTIHEEVLSGQ